MAKCCAILLCLQWQSIISVRARVKLSTTTNSQWSSSYLFFSYVDLFAPHKTHTHSNVLFSNVKTPKMYSVVGIVCGVEYMIHSIGGRLNKWWWQLWGLKDHQTCIFACSQLIVCVMMRLFMSLYYEMHPKGAHTTKYICALLDIDRPVVPHGHTDRFSHTFTIVLIYSGCISRWPSIGTVWEKKMHGNWFNKNQEIKKNKSLIIYNQTTFVPTLLCYVANRFKCVFAICEKKKSYFSGNWSDHIHTWQCS